MAITKEEIAKLDFDRKSLVDRVLKSEADRNYVIQLVTTDPNIMVYYQCFYILQDATSLDPYKFINYWDELAQLLAHKNSYHRDIAITLLANLIPADETHRLDQIFDKYLAVVYDNKFKTGVSCIINLGKILETRPDKIGTVFQCLMAHQERSKYPEKQEAYINGEIAKVFDQMIDKLNEVDRGKAIEFIRRCTGSKSPKTRKISQEIVKRRNIIIAST